MFGGDERTIAPTPRRLAEARRAGYAPRSQQLTAAVSTFAGIAAVCVLGDDLWQWMTALLHAAWSAPAVRIDESEAFDRMAGPFQRVAVLLAVLLAVPAIAALLGAGLQSGFRIGLRFPQSGWQQMAPQAGLRRIGSGFRLGAVVGLTAGVVAAGLLTGWIVNRSGESFAGDVAESTAVVLARLLTTLGLMLGGALLLLGVGDWILQRRRFWRSLRMTMAEAREEARGAKSPRRSRTRNRSRVSANGEGLSTEPLRDESDELVGAEPHLSSDPQIS